MPILETQISAVTVFPDRARVTRAGSMDLTAGAQTITVANLPPGLEESSVRVSGSGQAQIGGVRLERRFLETISLADAQAAQERLQALLDQDKIYADESESWQTRLSVVKNIGEQGGENFARSLARGKLSLEGLTNTLDYLSNSYEAASNALRDLAVRRRDLQKKIDAARQEAAKYANTTRRQVYDAQVDVQVATTGTTRLEITYAVYGASWEALYDARLQDNRLEWNYLAQVQQETGEDWRAPYDLTLSTATLATGIDKPELPPWRIDVYQPPPPRAMKMRGGPPMQAAPIAEMMMADEPEPSAAMAYRMAEVESSGPSVTYKIRAPRDIPSDGEPHQVNIARLDFDAALDYFCAPKAAEQAFVRTKFKNASEYLMLPGQVSLYHSQDFVGTRSLETVAPNQEIEFFLGAEPRLSVERKETQHEINKAGLMGNNAGASLAYRITIENPTLGPVHITVLDQIPVAQHADIKVKLREASPRPSNQNEQGELAWNLDVRQGEKAQIDFAVTVEYPKEMRIVGL